MILKLRSAKQFSGTAKHIPKNQNDAPEKKFFLYKIRFSGNLSFQTKLKHNLL